MKEQNAYDIHSVYLKSNETGIENWERIEGVYDFEAREDAEKVIPSYQGLKSKTKLKLNIQKSATVIPGAVRRIVKFFK
ncbi:hypothetical protein QEJ31_10455 [Pigmentibacter sp. JX0631]|uniref:hypothetical protein n=1 Tax=Pigmentibacter sp. JX0631 TaxID=2976982 RepID=UPI00246895B3|nr:hypothetical protein [Pigmentibacter sp. JX0631]WGL58941.1 hypothetical protein QEJ31_10455 [Pigmentibacter sp. JX0631]